MSDQNLREVAAVHARLSDIQAALLVVQNELVLLRSLVRDAHRLLNDDLEKLSWRDDVKDWTRAATPFVQS